MADGQGAGPGSLWALEGRWRLSRRIEHAGGATDRFEGEAVFERDGETLVQTERGVLETSDGARLEGSRRYLWRRIGGRLDCAFADGRAFHAIPLGEARPASTHVCDPDLYEVAYDFSAWPDWSTVWRVRGPRKDYVMTTGYSRLRPDAQG